MGRMPSHFYQVAAISTRQYRHVECATITIFRLRQHRQAMPRWRGVTTFMAIDRGIERIRSMVEVK